MDVVIVTLVILGFILLIKIGLTVHPTPFQVPALSNKDTKMVNLPEGLPEPVERFYKIKFGHQIPVIETVFISGHGRIRPFGIWMPARFIMIHNTGRDYRHYFEASIFGIPLLKVNEGYLDGKSFFESPMGSYQDDPNTNQGANLALWAEGGWFPSIWITDPRVHWQAVDAHTAILNVPFEDQEENFVVRFNPESGLIDLMEAMRFKNPGDKEKVLWLTNEAHQAGKPSVSYATWLDAGKPWAAFILDEVVVNVNVNKVIRNRGL